MKKIVGQMAIMFLGFQACAQFQVKDLLFSSGSWHGQLTYLDYTSGKPYSMAANLQVSLTGDLLGYIRRFEYPKEPQANSSDTIYINKQHFGEAKLVQYSKVSASEFSWITEQMGEDGNDHRKAILRQTYLIQADQYRIIKEVQFIGNAGWIKRHEYHFTR